MFIESIPEYIAYQYLKIRLMARWERSLSDERGMTTETVIITAVLSLAAVLVATFIFQAIQTKQSSISTDTPLVHP
jgi:hypothetical protein